MSDEAIEIEVEYSDEDLAAPARWTYLYEQPIARGLAAGAGGLVVSFALGFGWLSGLVEFAGMDFLNPIVETFGLILFGAFSSLLLVLGILLAGPFWFPGRWADRMGRPASPVQMCFSEAGVVVDTANRHSEVDWAYFDRIEESDDHFILRHGDRIRYWSVVPKRAFSSVDEQRRFVELLPEGRDIDYH